MGGSKRKVKLDGKVSDTTKIVYGLLNGKATPESILTAVAEWALDVSEQNDMEDSNQFDELYTVLTAFMESKQDLLDQF